MSPQAAALEAEELLALGFRAVKIKLGHGDLVQDLATIRTVREAVGNEIKLMVDSLSTLLRSNEEAKQREAKRHTSWHESTG